jgi:competence protein ComEA
MSKIKGLLLGLALALVSAFAMAAEMVNINTADADTLAAALNGIGPSKAAEIVRHREMNGPFADLESLTLVKGIGQRTLESNRGRLTVATP